MLRFCIHAWLFYVACLDQRQIGLPHPDMIICLQAAISSPATFSPLRAAFRSPCAEQSIGIVPATILKQKLLTSFFDISSDIPLHV